MGMCEARVLCHVTSFSNEKDNHCHFLSLGICQVGCCFIFWRHVHFSNYS